MTFAPLNGGGGTTVSCNTSTSTRAALPTLTGQQPTVFLVVNTGVNYGSFALGDSTIVATTSYTTLAPGDDIEVAIQFAGSEGAPTHIAGISTGGNTTLQITLGIAR